jgi:hypothetical protein
MPSRLQSVQRSGQDADMVFVERSVASLRPAEGAAGLSAVTLVARSARRPGEWEDCGLRYQQASTRH